MSWCEAKWSENAMGRANAFEATLRVFIRLAHLEGHSKQAQEFVCLGTVILDRVLNGLLEGIKQVVCVEKAATQARLDLKSTLPVHRLQPPLDAREVARREESLSVGIHKGNADGTRFTLHNVADLLKLKKIVWISENKTEMVGVWCDAGMGIIDRGYKLASLVFPLAFGPLFVGFLLETGGCM